MDYSARLEELRTELKELKEQRSRIVRTGQSWSLKNGDDSRAMTSVSLVQLNSMIKDVERQIASLEPYVDGSGRMPDAVRLVAKGV